MSKNRSRSKAFTRNKVRKSESIYVWSKALQILYAALDFPTVLILVWSRQGQPSPAWRWVMPDTRTEWVCIASCLVRAVFVCVDTTVTHRWHTPPSPTHTLYRSIFTTHWVLFTKPPNIHHHYQHLNISFSTCALFLYFMGGFPPFFCSSHCTIHGVNSEKNLANCDGKMQQTKCETYFETGENHMQFYKV